MFSVIEKLKFRNFTKIILQFWNSTLLGNMQLPLNFALSRHEYGYSFSFINLTTRLSQFAFC